MNQFIKIQFEPSGRIIGATIEKYLLEKTRVVHQGAGERNFHIFYQMLRGIATDRTVANTAVLLERCVHTRVQDFLFLQSALADTVIDGVSDEEEFETTCKCMTTVGIDSAMLTELCQVLFGLLHLGNISFAEDLEGNVSGVSEAATSTFTACCDLLGIDEESMLASLAKRNMHVGGSVIVKSQTKDQVRAVKVL